MKSKVFSVTQINTYIKRMFQSDYALRRISIKGQVSNCKYHSSGHIYFSLKEMCIRDGYMIMDSEEMR